MLRRIEEPPPDARAARPEAPEDVHVVLKHSLAVDPAARYPSAGQMADALDSALDLLPVT